MPTRSPSRPRHRRDFSAVAGPEACGCVATQAPDSGAGGRAFSDTIAYLSHVLRTPVTSLAAAVANLQDAHVADLSPTAERSLAVCQRNVERLRSTIERIEELAALEAHAPVLRAAPMRCAELADKIRRWMERLRSDELKRLHVEVPQPDAVAWTDGARLAQLLAQFLGASVALNDASVPLAARLEIVEAAGGQRLLRCAARGLGTAGAQGLTLPGATTERVVGLDRLLHLELSERLLRAFAGRVDWSHEQAAWVAALQLPADLDGVRQPPR